MRSQTVDTRPKASKTRGKKARKRRLLWLTEAQAALGWAVLLAMTAVLGAIYLHQTSGIAEVGRNVQNLQYELDEIKRTNRQLELQIAEAQSLERLQSEAERLGFVPAKPEDIEYRVVPEITSQNNSSSQYGPDSEPQQIETALEAIVRALMSRLGSLSRGEAE